jgi:zinc transport system substrate-binding protein
MMSRFGCAVAGFAITLAAVACAPAAGGERTVVASFYPLAFAAERIAGPGWEVIDLTPPGTEAHDVELTIEDRAAIEDADVVLYLGDVGFQPQVEDAVREARGRVVAVWEGSPGPGNEAQVDPHVWLDPIRYAGIVHEIGRAVGGPDTAEPLVDRLHDLDANYRAGLAECRFSTMLVSHEAFGYLAERYGIEQVGLAGLEPEAEPGAADLAQAEALLDEGRAGAVFYEAGGEEQRVAETIAGDAGVPALPLSTLESQPRTGDYLSAMEENLEALREGLGCR